MKVGIIGAGTMGSELVQAFAQTEGYEVYLCDITKSLLQTVKQDCKRSSETGYKKERKHRKMLMQS